MLKFAKVFAALAIVVVLGGCKVELHSKLSESEANEIVALLLRSGISASREYAKDGTSIVHVESDRFADAVAILNNAGLPRERFATLGEVFADNKLISSPTEERARFIFALSQELSRTLSEIDGVQSARIHVVLPRNDPLRLDEKPSSASVFIKHDQDRDIAPLLPQIKTLVANSIEGLTYDKVSVVFVASTRTLQVAEQPERARVQVAGVTDWTIFAFATGFAGWLIAIGLGILWWRARGIAKDEEIFMTPPRPAITFEKRDI